MQVNKTLINTNTFCYIIFAIGIIGSVALIIGALVAVAYLLTMALSALCRIATSISTLYHHADSLVQLLILCILACICYKIIVVCVRSVRKEVATW